MPMLQFYDGGRTVFVYALRGGRSVIGRADTCDLALPSDSVSRVHCIIDERTEGWTLIDRSRHGTFVNGKVNETVCLKEGDDIKIGTFQARFTFNKVSDAVTVSVSSVLHEELIHTDDECVVACRAELKFTRGPLQGRIEVIDQRLVTLGGPGSTVELDHKLPRDAVTLRVVRGRVMVEPGPMPVYLAGAMVRDLTPAFPGEELRAGDHSCIIETVHVEESKPIEAFGEMVAGSKMMKGVFGTMLRMAAHDAPILLIGESGTGKELAARAIHDVGPRFEKPFVALNCAAITTTLFESELFGHEKGSFTGATGRVDGAFQRANGGTLFLDEVGELQIDLQAKLLRVLESGEVLRVGAQNPEFPRVRVIAATNRHLPDMVERGTFRRDLYFRLAVLTVRLPALRERVDDIPLIADAILRRHHPDARLTPEAMVELQKHSWPGNARELRNVLTRAYVLTGQVIGPTSLSFQPWSFDDTRPSNSSLPATRGENDPERAEIVAALQQADGNRAHAARILGMPRSSLLYKLNRYGLMNR